MHRYRVHYRDDHDGGCPTFTMIIHGADRLHVEEKFFDGCEFDGWEIVKVERL